MTDDWQPTSSITATTSAFCAATHKHGLYGTAFGGEEFAALAKARSVS